MKSYISELFGEEINSFSIIGLSQANLERLSLSENQDFKDLEEYLNYVYYKKAPSSASRYKNLENFANNYAQAVAQNFNDIIDKWNPEDTGKIARNAYGLDSLSNRKTVSKNTYEAMLKQVNTKISLLDGNVDIYGELIELQNQLQSILGQKANYGIDRYSSKGSEQITKLMDNIVFLWDKVSYDANLPDNKALGNSFEQALTIAGSEIIPKITEKTTNDLIAILSSTKTAGAVKTSTLKSNLNSGLISYETRTSLPKTKEGESTKRSEYIIGSGKSHVRVSVNAFDGIQQKMDVSFQLPSLTLDNKNEIFRISAKSWASMSGDFGETTLLNAFLRTASIDSALAYGLQLSYSDNKNSIASLHKYAKQIAVLDILAGIGQKNGYADTIVIQDRQQQQIHVYSIAKILNEFDEKGSISNFKIRGYQEVAPLVYFKKNKRLGILKNKDGKVISNQQWMGRILSAIKKQKISIGYTKS